MLALYLHRPVDLVSKVYAEGGTEAVALVESESQFNPQAVRREPRGHSSYGLFQLDGEWHEQHRHNLNAHIRYGAALLAWLEKGRTFAEAVAIYNGGPGYGAFSRAWGRRVAAKRDELAYLLRWRELRELETAQ